MKFLSPAEFLKTLSRPQRADLAKRIGTTDGHLRNVRYGERSLSPLYAVRMERETAGVVPRQLSCPDDWAELWPDLQPLPEMDEASD